MENATAGLEFFQFMNEYADFLEAMVEQEKQKLESLLSHQLKRIEQSVSGQQAASMQVENYEKKRQQLQQRAGWDGLTFREIVEQSKGQEHETLRSVLGRMQRATGEIKFLNEKSLQVAKMRLDLLSSSASGGLPAGEETGYTLHGEKRQEIRNSSLFEAKI